MNVRAIFVFCCAAPTLACGSREAIIEDLDGGGGSGGLGGNVQGGPGGSGGSTQQDASTRDSAEAVCAALASPCQFSSQCCSHFCNAGTNKCAGLGAPEGCPTPCGPGSYCAPTLPGGPAQNTC